MSDLDWRALNRANWDERVPIHLAARIYDDTRLRAGQAKKNAIEEAELGSVDGLRLLHLQCHFGRDSLILAQRGATVVGLDFSPPAIAAARSLAAELGLFAVRVAADAAAPVAGRIIGLARLLDASAAVALALALRFLEILDLGQGQVGGLAALH